uniref:Uncharacterized protein n=1 Tax=viral metagenome TaxID=1070528 RepID=A0A6C0KYN7_9ZZZZ|tara:strand:+ start:4704 stop:6077 length:1374 start_codon:yes stop_codon:yes gene_type:complete
MTSKALMLKHMAAPIIAAPMFIVSNIDLVVNQCKSGIIGSFPALNARNEKKESNLDYWLNEIKRKLERATHHYDSCCPLYAVNQIVHKSNDRLMHDMEIIVKHEVPIVITSLGANEEINNAVHSYGGIVLHDVTNNKHAQKAYQKGADGLIAVACGAGGHAGELSPFALVQEIREWFNGPLALSGAISSGRSVAAAITMGADFAYIGSPFIATSDANACDDYKRMVIDSSSEDIVNTNLFTGINGNYLSKSIENAGIKISDMKQNKSLKTQNSKKIFSSKNEKPKAWSNIYGCGQGISNVKYVQNTMSLANRIINEYNDIVKPKKIPFLDSKSAKKILNAAQKKAFDSNWKVSICIVDSAGVPLYLKRIDGAFPASVDLAKNKAKTAALFEKPTLDLENAINELRPALLTSLSASGHTILGGGEPIFIENICVGAIGVSGVLPEQDAEVALNGITAI